MQGKLSDVDVDSVESRLTEVTTKYNDAKRNIADAKAKLEESQRAAEDMKDKADDLVRRLPFQLLLWLLLQAILSYHLLSSILLILLAGHNDS